jgi:AcrR family transcriptional regulator
MVHTVPYVAVLARSSVHANTKVGRDEWTRAALDVIAAEGIAGVRVEVLAQLLGITKGSFYWHFRDRQELIESALELWVRVATDEIIERLDRIDDPKARLRALFAESFGDVVNGPIEALLLSQVADSVIGPVIARATQARLAFLQRAFRSLGLSRADAEARARLTYAAYLGAGQLDRIDGNNKRSAGQSRAFQHQLTLLFGQGVDID